MRVMNTENSAETTTESLESLLQSYPSSVSHKTYHEMSDIPVVERDAFAQLCTNIAMLEDLQGRLSFVMREVRYLMKV